MSVYIEAGPCQSLTSSSSLLVIGHAFLISKVVQAHVHVYVRHKITTKLLII